MRRGARRTRGAVLPPLAGPHVGVARGSHPEGGVAAVGWAAGRLCCLRVPAGPLAAGGLPDPGGCARNSAPRVRGELGPVARVVMAMTLSRARCMVPMLNGSTQAGWRVAGELTQGRLRGCCAVPAQLHDSCTCTPPSSFPACPASGSTGFHGRHSTCCRARCTRSRRALGGRGRAACAATSFVLLHRAAQAVIMMHWRANVAPACR